MDKKAKKIIVIFSMMMVVTALLTGCGSKDKEAGSHSAANDTINIGIYDGSYLAVSVLVARDMGYFEDERLNMNWENAGGSGVAMISTGDLDMYTSGVNEVLTAVAEGETNVNIISGLMSEGCDYIALKDFRLDKLDDVEDFEGLTVAACTGDPGLLWTKELLKEKGANAEFTEFGSIAESVTAVQKGECEIGIICGASSYEAQMDGSCKILGQVVDFIGTFPCCRLQASTDMIQNHYDELVKIVRAQLKGYETYRNDKETVGKILSGISGQDAGICIAKMYDSEEYNTPMTVGIDPDTDAIIASYDKLKNLGIIDKDTPYDIKDYLNISIYQNALTGLMKEDPDNAIWQELMKKFEENNSILLAEKS